MPSLMRTTVADGIYRTLRDMILGLKFEPGQELNVVDLTERLQVSRSPVRDALMKLSNDKLVDIFPQKGTRVSLLDLDQVEEERFIRTGLEEQAVKRFVDRWTASDIAAMEAAIAQQKIMEASRSYEQFLVWDDTFHSIIFTGIGRTRSWQLIQSQCGNYHRIRLLSFWYEGVSHDVIAQHEQLVQAFKERNLDLVLEVEHRHLTKLLTEANWMMEKYPRFFVAPNQNQGDHSKGELR
ncbi:MAG: GntR family transcriptional regulator [Sphaerochaetaceae bacterium]